MTILIFLIIGLIVGSFLNVLAMRLHDAQDFIYSRSRCPHCKKKIRWYDNIPVLSFILLRFKCRDCKKKISWIYPVTEILTGLVFACVARHFFLIDDYFSWVETLYYLIISSALIAILIYDWLYMEIPSVILWVGVFVAVVFNLWADWSMQGELNVFIGRTYSGTLAATMAFLIFFLISAISREKWMGLGDAYLVILLGLILGWPEIFLALFLSFFIGALYGVASILLKKKKLKSQVPFAPFLVAATFVSIFYYNSIVDWYFSLFI